MHPDSFPPKIKECGIRFSHRLDNQLHVLLQLCRLQLCREIPLSES